MRRSPAKRVRSVSRGGRRCNRRQDDSTSPARLRRRHRKESAEQSQQWEEMKAVERSEGGGGESLLDDVPVALPALSRAAKLQRRAARCGFDWPNADEVFEKIAEELRELREAVHAGRSRRHRRRARRPALQCRQSRAPRRCGPRAVRPAPANAKFERPLSRAGTPRRRGRHLRRDSDSRGAGRDLVGSQGTREVRLSRARRRAPCRVR